MDGRRNDSWMCRSSSLSYDALNETQGRCRPHLETGAGLYLAGWDMRHFFRRRGRYAKLMGRGRPA